MFARSDLSKNLFYNFSEDKLSFWVNKKLSSLGFFF